MDARAGVGDGSGRRCEGRPASSRKAADGNAPPRAARTAASSFYDVFGKFYRYRAITVLFCSLLGNIAAVAASSWAYFHLVRSWD